MRLRHAAAVSASGTLLALGALTGPAQAVQAVHAEGTAGAPGTAAAASTCPYQGYWYTGTATTSYGNTGARVKEVQCLLYSAGYLPSSGVDGVFGSSTRSAVRSFQAMYRSECNPLVAVDGIVGVRTWAALRSACPA
ncbi:peptidoglycan-binding domain-containing protein [Streptomyces sp. NPDC050703]|uniref:peptidoglycan-binding domain-containing protein n=1 Tax=Streptomyces sp. NPDC050703 TaxID=3157218 RepID=UPI003440E8C0